MGVALRYCNECDRLMGADRARTCSKCRRAAVRLPSFCRVCRCATRHGARVCSVCETRSSRRHEGQPRCGQCGLILVSCETEAKRLEIPFGAKVNVNYGGLCVGCSSRNLL